MKMHRRSSVTVGVAALALALVLPAQAATAASTTPEDAPSPEEVHSQVVGNTLTNDVAPTVLTVDVPAQKNVAARGPAVSGVVTCNVEAQNPHKSTGAGYALYKTRVSCSGVGTFPPTVTILVKGGLMWDSANYAGDTSNGIVWSTLRGSNESRTVSVNGSQNTFYTPQLGTAGPTLTGHYQGSSTVQITSLPSTKVGSDISNVQFLKF